MIRALRRKYWHLLANSADARALVELSKIDKTFRPWSVMAMRPSSLLCVLNEVIINRRRKIVELGAGISTLYLTKTIRDYGGQLITIDENSAWLGEIGELVGVNDPDLDWHYLHSNLVGSSVLPGTMWYDIDNVKKVVGEGVDLLLIDGPTAGTIGGNLNRGSAWPALRDCLSDNCCIILDDALRPGEQRIIRDWSCSESFDFKLVTHFTGICLMYRKKHWISHI